MIDLKEKRKEFDVHMAHLEQELKSLRTGRATAALVEHITVDAYGTPTPLQHLATISVSDARTIVIAPWDKTVLKEIEKAIVQAQMGINPVNDGVVIRVIMPVMTEENRKSLVKTMGQKLEQARIGVRSVRDEIKEEILREEKEKMITEDDRYELLKKLDDVTKEYTERMNAMGQAKEEEIMTI
jgi:ribosome recycling factor